MSSLQLRTVNENSFYIVKDATAAGSRSMGS